MKLLVLIAGITLISSVLLFRLDVFERTAPQMPNMHEVEGVVINTPAASTMRTPITHNTVEVPYNESAPIHVPEVVADRPAATRSNMPPSPSSMSAHAVYTLTDGVVLAGAHAAAILPIASITKLMTAIVVQEYLRDDVVLTVPEEALVYTSTPRLKAGEEIALSDALALLLAESSNEAALVISHHVEDAQFVALMNAKAREIGMRDTRFVDSSGASAENVSTANDLLLLAQHIQREHPDIFVLTKAKGNVDGIPDLENYNHYENDPQFIGGKTGKTREAGETMLAVFVEEETQHGVRVYVVFGSDNAKQEVDTLRRTIR
jgi:D-alanyl-D-alanine carboxypeptidase